jgi:predicted Zn-dependent protease
MRSPRSSLGPPLVAAGLVLSIALSCARNPVTGQRELSLMSEAQEVSLGRESDPQIVAAYGLYEDAKLQAYVDRVGQKMARISHRPNLKFTFRVLDSPVINAFALPGGYVYVTRGILAHMNNEAELAVVLGHEIGHVTARHGVNQYSRAQLAGLGLGLGSILVPQVAQFGQLAETALGLLFLKYGRDDETQSDELGVQYALQAGYDATAGVRFFEVLDRMSQESGQSLPSWLSTHPNPGDRVARTRQLSQAQRAQFPAATLVAEPAHKQTIDGVVFGEDPRQGFVEGGVFKHPELRFQLAFPSGWTVQNTPAAVMAGEPNNRAVLQLTLEASQGLAPRQYAARVVESAQGTLAEGGAERIGGFDAFVTVIQLPAEGGGTTPVFAAFVQREAGGPIFQIVGQAAQGAFAGSRTAFLTTARSLRTLTDAKALAIQPNKLEVQAVKSRTTLQQAASKAATPVGVPTIALLNNLAADATLQPGFQLKLVRGTYKSGSGG